MSDILAQIAVGAQNRYFNTSYVSKNKWDETYLRNSLTDKLYERDDSMDFREPETYELLSKHGGSKHVLLSKHGGCKHEFMIEHNIKSMCEISDLRLHIKLNDFNNSAINHILNWKFELIIGGLCVDEMDMITNLFLCKVMKKKIKETCEELIIPIVFFDVSSYTKFPLYLLYWHEVSIRIYTKNELFELSMFVDKYNIDANIDPEEHPGVRCAFCQTQLHSFENSETIKCLFNHPTQFIYVVFDSEDIFTQPQINKIFLYLNNLDPIKWETYLDEIIHIKIFDKIIYIVSLIPDIRVIRDIRKMFKELKHNEVNNAQCKKKFDIPVGINFSRIDIIKLSFEFDDINYENASGTVGAINLNLLGFRGMCHLAFCN
jgi:hypothetical protein